MEVMDHLNTEFTEDQNDYLQRLSCPGCFASSQVNRLHTQSTPPAERLTLKQHGKFLSGYTNQRVFFSYYRCLECQLLYCPTYFKQEQLDDLYKYQSENMGEVPLQARARTQKAYYQLLNKFSDRIGQGGYLEIGADIGLFAKCFVAQDKIDNMFLYEPNCEVHKTLKKNVANKQW